jgi:hypothetical protein
MVEQADGLSHYMMTFGFYFGFSMNRIKLLPSHIQKASYSGAKLHIFRFLLYLVVALPAIIIFAQYEVFKGGFEDNKDYEGKAWYKYASNTFYGFYTGLCTMYLAPLVLNKVKIGLDRDSVEFSISEK